MYIGVGQTLVGRGVHLVHQHRQYCVRITTHAPPSSSIRSERPTAVITAAIIPTTHPRVLNRSLVAWDAAGAPDGTLWWLLLDGRFTVKVHRCCGCFAWCFGRFVWEIASRWNLSQLHWDRSIALAEQGPHYSQWHHANRRDERYRVWSMGIMRTMILTRQLLCNLSSDSHS